MGAEKRVQEALEAIKRGEMVVMIDDEDRENEGDLVYASVFSTPKHVNFMATHAKGLICVATSPSIAERLNLTPMVSNNDSSYETAFTVSVDAKEALTGISAAERDMTIKILSNPLSSKNELVRPGHIFPLIAKEGGVLIRTGHTEGSVDLCRLAGLAESAVICEIIKEDGTMARRDDLDIFCEKHQLKTIFISDLVEFRLKNESLLTLLDSSSTNFFAKPAIKEVYEDHMGHKHTAIIFGERKSEMAVKVHNIGLDTDLFLHDEKHQHFNRSIDYLQKHGGVLLLIEQPAIHNEQMKEYGIGALMLQALSISKIRLLSLHHQHTAFVGIQGFGLEVIEQVVV